MTEAEWNACTDPGPMLEFLRGKASDRKLRLFAVACCRRIHHLLADDRSQRALDVAEKFADGLCSEAERLEAEALAWSAYCDLAPEINSVPVAHFPAAEAAEVAVSDNYPAFAYSLVEEADSGNSRDGNFLRDIFGPLPRRISLNPAWLTPTVTAIAQTVYEDRAFDRLPILADALEDAGCTNQDILAHCRQPGEHCRGCWVVDLLLGKE